ncbi:Protein of unknown function [Pasteurella testudinis DSM 23072]|uniref:Uncharacterized protein n=1 Tax=Pasteurella testudinis DSM 23072 TaxID=1122938 RepID=A0A1W1V4N4_9PAST|nr:secA translation cis-regulator SecM [Pasteurella testudinis]SMB88282.1 Protein of unknown function [Pasteurella testudinis DSM 23072]SUB51139.1 Protein of uncharacterised function (DUF2547) [Pasteurella testudinis]
MNLLQAYRKPHFWSQFLLGIIAILSVPVNAATNQAQPTYNQTCQQIQQAEQNQPLPAAFYQQQQSQAQRQQSAVPLPAARPLSPRLLAQSAFKTVPPIRAGPQYL